MTREGSELAISEAAMKLSAPNKVEGPFVEIVRVDFPDGHSAEIEFEWMERADGCCKWEAVYSYPIELENS